MLYDVSEEERARIKKGIDSLFGENAVEQVEFTGSSISPYNVKQVLWDEGFTDEAYDQNGFDNWWYFKHPKRGWVVIDFSAESFALKIYRRDEE